MDQRTRWRWLLPGIKIKRWLFLSGLGVVIILLGFWVVMEGMPGVWLNSLSGALDRSLSEKLSRPQDIRLARWLIGGSLGITGLLIWWWGLRRAWKTLISILQPRSSGRVWDVLARHSLTAQGKRITVVGGGTGLSTMLRGLKRYTANITAVVTVTDDGGSSGRLRAELGVPPPGDIRNCLVALADAEPTMTALFQYRFEGGGHGLSGHSFGNLLIAAMTNITGDFERAVKEISKVLAIRGRVLPSTLAHLILRAEMDDGACVEGETAIVAHPARIRRMYIKPPDAVALEEAIDAIRQADIVILGPGSLFTSVLPNLLVQGIEEATYRANALRVYVCNVMTQPGETDGFTASDHVRTIEAHVGRRIFDYVLVNKALPRQDLIEKYRQSGQEFVEPDIDRIRAMGYRPVTGHFISESDVVRHDPLRLAEAILKLGK
jgi:uncharacterized cofD-like protein